MIKKLYNTFFLTKYEKYLYKKFYINKNKIRKQNTILIQTVEDHFYYGLFGQIASSLRAKNTINVEQIVIRNLNVGAYSSILGFFKNIFIHTYFRDLKWIKLYSSFANDVAFRYEEFINPFKAIQFLVQSYYIFKQLKTKNDILNINYSDISIGELIYDSYLRYKPAPTVDIKDYFLYLIIYKSLKNIYISKKYFKKSKPLILLTSYSSYIQHGIVVKVALQNNVFVYSFGNEQKLEKRLSLNDFYHTANFKNYSTDFKIKNINKSLLQEANQLLKNRLKGHIDIATSYMKESAYKVSVNILPNVEGHLIIFLHDFYDSIYNYGDLVFVDFIEWIEYTIKVLEKNNIPYYLKPHPNQIEDSAKVIENLKLKYPKLNILSSKITNKQLVDAKISCGVTVYGTVAHELVYMGVPVIMCAQNPHSSYTFTYEAKNMEEYKNFLLDFDKLSLPKDYKQQVESFYYMHNLNKTDSEINLLKIISEFRKLNLVDNQEKFDKFNDLIEKLDKNEAFNNFINIELGPKLI